MANSCLQTKLKEVVNNDKLPKVGELVLYINSTSTINTSIIKQGDNPVELRASSGVTITSGGTKYPKFTGTGCAFVKEKSAIIELITSSNMNDPYITLKYEDIKYCSQLQNLAIYNNNVDGLNSVENLNVFPILAFMIANYNLTGNLANCTTLKNTLQTLSIKNITGLHSTMSDLGQFKVLSRIEGWDSTVFSGALEDFVSHRYILGETYKNGDLYIRYPHFNENVTFLGSSITPMQEGTLQWSVSGDDVSVTWGGESTIIHVNNDGTWTRVS